jgi:hypothetical protein
VPCNVLVKPRPCETEEAILLKPVPKLVLKTDGAEPNPTNPDVPSVENPLLKPLLKLLPINCELNGLTASLRSGRMRRLKRERSIWAEQFAKKGVDLSWINSKLKLPMLTALPHTRIGAADEQAIPRQTREVDRGNPS